MFDARAARALAPGDHLTFPEAPGLRLVASVSHRAWVYRYRSPVDGLMRQVRLGRWPAVSFAGALAHWERLRIERAAGRDPAAEKRAARRQAAQTRKADAYTVAAACDEFLRAYARTVAPKTYAEAARLLARDLGPLADVPAASVTRAQAFDLLESRAEAPVVAAGLRRVLGAVWDRALDAGRLPAETPNWWRLVMRGRLRSQGKVVDGVRRGVSKRVLSEAELALLLPWLPNFTRDIEDAIALYLWTGCRGVEIVRMRAACITEEADGWWWTLPRAELKMGRHPLAVDLRVPLVGRALAVVQRRMQAHSGGGFLFPSRGKAGHVQQKAVGVAVWCHMPECTLRPEWSRPRLPVAQWAPHDLRRTVRTQLAAMGCADSVAEAILGHIQPGVQGIYNRHGYDNERREWLTRWADRLEALGGRGRAISG